MPAGKNLSPKVLPQPSFSRNLPPNKIIVSSTFAKTAESTRKKRSENFVVRRARPQSSFPRTGSIPAHPPAESMPWVAPKVRGRSRPLPVLEAERVLEIANQELRLEEVGVQNGQGPTLHWGLRQEQGGHASDGEERVENRPPPPSCSRPLRKSTSLK